MEAELSGADKVMFAASLTARVKDPEVAHLLKTEAELFFVRKAAREGQKSILREQATGLREQIAGKDKELNWISQELVGVHELLKKNLVPFTRVIQLERDAARIAGERGALLATIPDRTENPSGGRGHAPGRRQGHGRYPRQGLRADRETRGRGGQAEAH